MRKIFVKVKNVYYWNVHIKIIKRLRNLYYQLFVRRKLKNKDFTIISQNCIGGCLYHDYGMKFYSPTINLYFEGKDFIKFCSNLKHYLNFKPKHFNKGDINAKYPIVLIDDIKLYCLHYHNFDEFLDKWFERSKRVNYDNIFLIMTERDGCTHKDLVDFDNLPYKNKVVLTYKKYDDIKSSFSLDRTDSGNKNYVIAPTDFQSKLSIFRYCDKFDFIKFFNNKD